MSMTIYNAMKKWLATYIKPCREKKTCECYENAIHMIMTYRPEYNTKTLEELTETEIQTLLNDLGYEYAKSSIRKVILVFKKTYQKAIKNDKVQ